MRENRGSGEAVGFEVEWKLDYAPTWESMENHSEELVSGYLKRAELPTERKQQAGNVTRDDGSQEDEENEKRETPERKTIK